MNVCVEPVTEAAPAAVHRRRWVALVEVAVAAAAIVLDVGVPTLVVLVMVAASLGVRREGVRTLGLVRLERPLRTAGEVLAIVAGWTVVQLGVFMPVLEHVTGEHQDVSEMAEVEGNLGRLLAFLALSWTVAAVGEELVYRGYVPTRLTDAAGRSAAAAGLAVVLSSVLFGLAHREQGVIGVGLTFLDALVFSALRLRYRSLWAPILAHGFNNTIGLVALYFVGPVTGWW